MKKLGKKLNSENGTIEAFSLNAGNCSCGCYAMSKDWAYGEGVVSLVS